MDFKTQILTVIERCGGATNAMIRKQTGMTNRASVTGYLIELEGMGFITHVLECLHLSKALFRRLFGVVLAKLVRAILRFYDPLVANFDNHDLSPRLLYARIITHHEYAPRNGREKVKRRCGKSEKSSKE